MPGKGGLVAQEGTNERRPCPCVGRKMVVILWFMDERGTMQGGARGVVAPRLNGRNGWRHHGAVVVSRSDPPVNAAHCTRKQQRNKAPAVAHFVLVSRQLIHWDVCFSSHGHPFSLFLVVGWGVCARAKPFPHPTHPSPFLSLCGNVMLAARPVCPRRSFACCTAMSPPPGKPPNYLPTCLTKCTKRKMLGLLCP